MNQSVSSRDANGHGGRFSLRPAQVVLLAQPVLLSVLLLFLAGCSGASAGGDPAPDSGVGPATGEAEADEMWIALYFGADKVGYQHIQRRPVQRDGKTWIEIDRTQVINVLRFKGHTEIRMTSHVVETPDERLVRFESTSDQGGGALRVTGHVEGGRLQFETQAAGGSRVESISWDDAPCGVMAWENSVENDPLEPGERRSAKQLVVDFGRPQIVDVELQADRLEETALLEGKHSLLRLQVETRFPDQPVTTKVTAWCDERGKVLKSESPFDDQKKLTAYVVTREAALAKGKPLKLDIGLTTMVKVERRLEHPHATRRIVYEAHLPEGDPSTAFLTTTGQAVEKIDEHTARVTVTAVRPAAGPAPPTALADPGDLAANSLIESDTPEVMAMARSAAPAERDPWKLALALENLVHDEVHNKNFSTALATAAQTARSREGDCTEHAMLLAALCRARKIPARVAIGLVYVDAPDEEQRGFAYHMWTEVAINGEWIPIDATLGQGGIGAAHLTLVETNFAAAGIDAFLPVLNVIGKLKLKIVDVE